MVGGIFNDSPILTLKLHVNMEDVIMQKVVNVLLSLFIIGLVFGCGSSYEKTPVNITAEPDGKTTWTSSFGVGTVKIHRAFTYVGVEDRSDAKVRRFYHVWKK